MKQIEELAPSHTYEEAKPHSLLSPYMHTAINAVASRTREGGGKDAASAAASATVVWVAAPRFAIAELTAAARAGSVSVCKCRLYAAISAADRSVSVTIAPVWPSLPL